MHTSPSAAEFRLGDSGHPERWFAFSAVLLSVPLMMSVPLWHSRLPATGDRFVARWMNSPRIGILLARLELDQFWAKPGLRSVAALGGPSVLIVVMASIMALGWWRRDRLLALLALIGPVVAGALTEWVGKPLVDRRIDGVHPTFPSGHVTTAAAIAALLFVATRRTATTKRRRILTMVVWVIPAAVAVSVLRLGWHVATDALAGIGVGAGVVFGTLGVLTVAANAISGAGTARHKSGLRR